MFSLSSQSEQKHEDIDGRQGKVQPTVPEDFVHTARHASRRFGNSAHEVAVATLVVVPPPSTVVLCAVVGGVAVVVGVVSREGMILQTRICQC